MTMYFKQYDMEPIIKGTRVFPVVKDIAAPTDVEVRNIEEWKRDNARTASLIASALSQPVADLVLTCTKAKDIWDKVISVYEQSITQRLSLLTTEFFKPQREQGSEVAAYIAKVEKLFSNMNTELRRRGSIT